MSEPLIREKVVYLTGTFGSQSSLAQALDVSRSRVSRWLRSEMPDAQNRARLEALEYVLSRLSSTLGPDSARKWLQGFNAHLGNRRPIDLLRDGRVAEVIAAVEAMETGAYA